MHKYNGFSLVELMVVLSIVGIIVGLALPKFKALQVRARQAEVKSNLNHIYTLQIAYHSENEIFAGVFFVGDGVKDGPAGPSTQCNSPNDLGFSVTDCQKVLYMYAGDNTNTADEFDVYALSGEGEKNKVLPGCGEADEWSLNAEKRITHEENVLDLCPL